MAGFKRGLKLVLVGAAIVAGLVVAGTPASAGIGGSSGPSTDGYTWSN